MPDIPNGPDGAAAFVDTAIAGKPQLLIEKSDLPATARAVRDLLAGSGRLFGRDMPVLVVPPPDGGPPSARALNVNNVVIEVHRACQPVRRKNNDLVSVTLPERVASMYLDMVGEHNLPPLAGVTTSPLLEADGSIRAFNGYDPVTKLWCSRIPDIGPMVPMTPMRDQADAALRLLREAFKTFPFADAIRCRDVHFGVDVVDRNSPPGADESAFLVALLTAVCRPSLPFAPGLLVSAPAISGAGSGKGLLVRSICAIAFGVQPRAFTTGGDRQELDKRLAAEFIEASPVLFLDNANGMVLNSDTLASVMTERPARVRILGETRMAELNSTAFIAATGNALTPSGDLARRFMIAGLDSRCEDPEVRPFKPGFLEEIQGRRAELLVAALTIWRHGRQDSANLKRGKPLGSFETWGEWCRDPLLALGCRDPVERIAEAKLKDPRRQYVAAVFEMWWKHHKSMPIRAAELADEVTGLIDPQRRGRQYVATELSKLAETRAAGFVLNRQKGAGKWSIATYSLRETDSHAGDGIGHRDHRGDQGSPSGAPDNKPPGPVMRPEPYGSNRNGIRTPPGICAGCSSGDLENDPLLPFGAGPAGHTWLHRRCWPDWYQEEMARADAVPRNIPGRAGA